jgi:hypothetical protein
VDEPKVVKLAQSSGHLKQYIRELSVVAVLLEIHPQVHLIPFQEEENPLVCELLGKELHNILAVCFFCLC